MPDFAPSAFLSVLLMAAAGASTPTGGTPSDRVQLAQLTIEQRVIIRIPIIRDPDAPRSNRASLSGPLPEPPQLPEIKEVKGPKCLKLEHLRGAVVNSETGITVLTDKDEAFRAHFGKVCRPGDFWAGFYIEPNKDGSVCAGRDALHARSGSNCDIEKFTKIVPEKPRKRAK